MKKRFLSLSLALAFVFSLMAMPAMASVKDDPAQPCGNVSNEICPECGGNIPGTHSPATRREPCVHGGSHVATGYVVTGTCANCHYRLNYFYATSYDCGYIH